MKIHIYILTVFLLTIFSGISGLKAQESGQESEPQAAPRNRRIIYSVSSGSFTGSSDLPLYDPAEQRFKGDSASLLFHAEYQPSYTGFYSGLSVHYFTYYIDLRPEYYISLLQITGYARESLRRLPAEISDRYFSLLNTAEAAGLFLISSQKSIPVTLFIPSADGGISFHLFPDKPWDPYLMAGIGAGYCGLDCTMLRGSVKSGLRRYFNNFFVFAEAEYSEFRFEGSVSSLPIARTVAVNAAAGAGFRL